MGCYEKVLSTPYEKCSFLLQKYESELRKKKDNYNTIIKQKEGKKTDENIENYKIKITDYLEEINKSIKTTLEAKRLKALNELFQSLLTEESVIYGDIREEEKKQGKNGFNEILVLK